MYHDFLHGLICVIYYYTDSLEFCTDYIDFSVGIFYLLRVTEGPIRGGGVGGAGGAGRSEVGDVDNRLRKRR
jgi:hypothetical protein